MQTIQYAPGKELNVWPLRQEEESRLHHDLDGLHTPVSRIDVSKIQGDLLEARELLDRWEIEYIWMEYIQYYKLFAEAHKCYTDGKIYGRDFRVHKLEREDCSPMDCYRVVVGLVVMDEDASPRVNLTYGVPIPTNAATLREWTEVEPAMDYHVVKHIKLEKIIALEPGHFLTVDAKKWQPIGVVYR